MKSIARIMFHILKIVNSFLINKFPININKLELLIFKRCAEL